jgi:GNAT superfamily N-acetyltransferase
MTSVCTIRKLDRDDAEAWVSLRREALEAHPLAFGASIPEDPRLLVESILTRLTSNEESAVFGAFIGGSLIGIGGIRRNPGAKERHKALIWGMYVTAGRRRNGAGDMLLRAAIQQARSWTGVEQVHLAVSEVAQEARRLYERNGFQEWGREPLALCWEGRCADESHMVLDLRESSKI